MGYHDHDHSAIFEKSPLNFFFGCKKPQQKKPNKNIYYLIALWRLTPTVSLAQGLFHQDSSWVGPGALVKSAAQLKDLQIKAFASSKLTSKRREQTKNLWKHWGGSSYYSSKGMIPPDPQVSPRK